MGRYINSFEGFVNESKLIDIASQYIEPTEIDTKMPDSELMGKLVQKIKSEKGDAAADEFVLKAASMNEEEEECTDCVEMMEPCDACKAHAAEMAADDDN